MDASYLNRGAYTPINPHGRPMPSDWKNPRSDSLYRVYVSEDKTGKLLPVSPAVISDVAASMLEAVTTAIKVGRIRGWSDAHLRLVYRGRELGFERTDAIERFVRTPSPSQGH